MKRFYFTDRPYKRGDRFLRIYRMEDGIMKMLCTAEYRPGSTRGALHEAYNALIEHGYIPKKWYSSSRSDWMGEGYFYGSVTEYYSIQEIV